MRLNEFFSNLKKGQKEFGEDMGVIINSILLTVVYLIGAGFTFIISKLSRKRFLDLNINRDKKSYWEDLNLGTKKMEEYYRQF